MNKENNSLENIFSSTSIRVQSEKIVELAKKGKTNFSLFEDKLPACSDYVLKLIYENYPNLNIPFHSRFRHFNAGQKENPKINRLRVLNECIKDLSPIEKIKEKWDLVVPSVLLDAGAGMQWKYFDKKYNETFSKSEGLALASLDMYYDFLFADADNLINIETKTIEKYFQVNSSNPLIGAEGRATLLQNLGHMMIKNPQIFKNKKVSDILDTLVTPHSKSISALNVFKAVIDHLGDIWPGRLVLNDKNLGDTWKYNPLSTPENSFLISFHKLSQWLTYSLLEPFTESGIKVTDLNQLTGLAEYRNGGLFLDFGVIELKNPHLSKVLHEPGSDLIIEWRAFTIYLLDKLANIIQEKLKKTPLELPLIQILEGGTWWAGRKIAKEKRQDGGPPLEIKSDGTLF